eukprot:5462140-Prymnesium_polylepis.1
MPATVVVKIRRRHAPHGLIRRSQPSSESAKPVIELRRGYIHLPTPPWAAKLQSSPKMCKLQAKACPPRASCMTERTRWHTSSQLVHASLPPEGSTVSRCRKVNRVPTVRKWQAATALGTAASTVLAPSATELALNGMPTLGVAFVCSRRERETGR